MKKLWYSSLPGDVVARDPDYSIADVLRVTRSVGIGITQATLNTLVPANVYYWPHPQDEVEALLERIGVMAEVVNSVEVRRGRRAPKFLTATKFAHSGAGAGQSAGAPAGAVVVVRAKGGKRRASVGDKPAPDPKQVWRLAAAMARL